ncbi:hypothetical protein MMC11_007880 [Xylographa trunciseda]|nr:hypothetical protein [Xylographa trunciseda]
MNGDTITVNVPSHKGHRAKRIKIEQAIARSNVTTRHTVSERTTRNSAKHGNTVETVQDSSLNESHKTAPPSKSDRGVSTAGATHALQQGNTNVEEQHDMEHSTSSTFLSPELAGTNTPNSPSNIDFSSAPSGPIELAWWVAQQITHIHSRQSESLDMEADEGPLSVISHPPGMHTRHSDADLEPLQMAERERLRGDNRERKKRWRETNAERNKDNDLKCRINKRAKAKFGVVSSVEKTAYIETEFNKRRNKRENKQRARAVEAGEFPSYVIAPELGDRIFSSQNPNLSSEVQTAGNLLMNALFGVGSDGNQKATTEAAAALRAALEDGTLDSKPFIEALKVMALNAELMRGINSKLDDGDDEDNEAFSGDENESQPLHSATAHAESITPQSSTSQQQSSEIIKALNAATALLNQMTDTKVYASPYGNPPPPPPAAAVAPAMDVNGDGATKPNGTDSAASTNETNKHGLDQSQIDAILSLANGGSLTDDEDDKTIADPDEVNAQELDLSGMPQADMEVTATLQRIIKQFTTERNGGIASSEPPTLSNGELAADPYGLLSVEQQAIALNKLFLQAGVSINTIMPAAQGQATSQFFVNLSNRARSSPPSGGINPAHAGTYGNTAQMQQRMLAKPGIFGQPQYQLQHPFLPSVPMPTTTVGAPMTRTITPEEQLKIKSYGYPPLPGSRPGAKRKT